MIVRIQAALIAAAAVAAIVLATVAPVIVHTTTIADKTFRIPLQLAPPETDHGQNLATIVANLAPDRIPCSKRHPHKTFNVKRTCTAHKNDCPGMQHEAAAMCGIKTETEYNRCKSRKGKYCVKINENNYVNLLSHQTRAIRFDQAETLTISNKKAVKTCTAAANQAERIAYIANPAWGGIACDGTQDCTGNEDEAGCKKRRCAAKVANTTIEYTENDDKRLECAHACTDEACDQTTTPFVCKEGGNMPTYCANTQDLCSVFNTVCEKMAKLNECKAKQPYQHMIEPTHPHHHCQMAKTAAATAPIRTQGIIIVATAAIAAAIALAFGKKQQSGTSTIITIAAAAAIIATTTTTWIAVIAPVQHSLKKCKPKETEVEIHPAAYALIAASAAAAVAAVAATLITETERKGTPAAPRTKPQPKNKVLF